MVETPLVLHGGSGLTDEDFRKAIANRDREGEHLHGHQQRVCEDGA